MSAEAVQLQGKSEFRHLFPQTPAIVPSDSIMVDITNQEVRSARATRHDSNSEAWSGSGSCTSYLAMTAALAT